MPGAIIHVDMDAYFAAVEMLDRPELRGRPVIVAGSPAGRGVVATASYEARRFGVHSAMSAREAYRLCPQAVFVRPRFERYVELSRQIMAILGAEGAQVETMSIDEAYVDPGAGDAAVVARRIKDRIRSEIGLTASVGVAPNRFLAKIASDLRKPDGFLVIAPEQVDAILVPLPVRALPGIGPKTSAELGFLGIGTVADLRAADRGLLRLQFGRRADELLGLAYGQDDRPLQPEHETKSISTETTFETDIADWAELRTHLHRFAAELGGRLQESGWRARTVTVKLRFADFRTVSRSQSGPAALAEPAALALAAEKLLGRFPRLDSVRLIGLQVSGLTTQPSPVQISFDFLNESDAGGRKEDA